MTEILHLTTILGFSRIGLDRVPFQIIVHYNLFVVKPGSSLHCTIFPDCNISCLLGIPYFVCIMYKMTSDLLAEISDLIVWRVSDVMPRNHPPKAEIVKTKVMLV